MIDGPLMAQKQAYLAFVVSEILQLIFESGTATAAAGTRARMAR